MRFISLTLGMALIIFWARDGFSQHESPTPAAPIRIEADRMETSQDQSIIKFSGHVQANQDNLVINADEMTVRYTGEKTAPGTPSVPGSESLTQQIDSIVAHGNVKIVQGDWIATGEAMDFDAAKRIVILSVNARAWQDQNMISGEKITLYLDEGRSVVERSSQEGERVKAFIIPSTPEKKQGKNP